MGSFLFLCSEPINNFNNLLGFSYIHVKYNKGEKSPALNPLHSRLSYSTLRRINGSFQSGPITKNIQKYSGYKSQSFEILLFSSVCQMFIWGELHLSEWAELV